MAYQDELAAANRLPTREARLAARNAVRAKYGMEAEQRKRGGVAGIYDRNKKLVSAAATAAGYMLGGPAGAGLARGAVQGLDRPGQGGIGFDFKRGAKGFAEGYGAGGVANIGKAGLQKLFTANAPSAGAAPAGTAITRTAADARGMLSSAGEQGDLVAQAMQSGRALPPPVTPPAGMSLADVANANVVGTPRSLSERTISALLQPEVLAPLAGGVADVIGSAQDRAVQERRIQLEEEQMRREQERQERLAQLLMPLFQQQVSQFGGRR